MLGFWRTIGWLAVLNTLVLSTWHGCAQPSAPAIDHGQWVELSRLTTREGLPSNSVYSLFADHSNGTMLLGTERGLYRYDGTRYSAITGARQPGAMIDNLFRDKHGLLWCHDYRSNAYVVFQDRLWGAPKPGLGPMKVLFRSDVGDVWALCNHGLARWNQRLLAWEKHPVGKFIKGVLGCVFYGDTIVMNSRSDVLHRYNWRTKSTLSEAIATPHKEIAIRQVKRQTYVWRRTGSRPQRLLGERFRAVESWPKAFPVVISEGDSTAALGLWLATDKGLMIKTAAGSWQRMTSDWATDAVEDNEGTLWVSTRDRGVQRFARNSIRHVPIAADIRRIAVYRGGKLILGAAEGKIIRCNALGKVVSKKQFPISFEIENVFVDTLLNVRAEHRDFFINGSLFTHLFRDGSLPPRAWDAQTGLVLLNDYPGVSMICFDDTKTVPMPDAYNFAYGEGKVFASHLLHNLRISDMCIDHTGKWLLLASEGGLLRSSATGIDTIRHPDGSPLLVRSLCRLAGNSYLLATFDQGLWLSHNGKQSKEVRGKDGRSLKVEMVAATGSRAVLVRPDGLQLYDAAEDGAQLSRVIGVEDGLLKSDIKTLALRAHGAWLATTQGLSWVPFSAFDTRVNLQALQLDGVRQDGLPVQLSSLAHLPHDLNTLEFAVHRTTLRYAERLQLKYRLAGRSEQWQQLPAGQNTFQLLGLKPGAYQLEIKSEVNGDLGTADVLTIDFNIRPAWWNTWWFWLIVVLMLFVTATMVYQYRERRIRKRAAFDARLAEAELSALRAQMNPHFMFNALNSLQAAIMKADKLRAMRLLKTFAGLLRTTVDYAQASYLPLRIEIEQLERYIELQESRFSDALHIDFRLPNEGLERQIPAMFIIPFVENAFEHGLRNKRTGEKHLLIALEWQNTNTLHVVIEDNGIGREAAMALKARQNLHKSFGLISITERLSLYNPPGRAPMTLDIQDLRQPDGSAAGTRIELILPTQPVDHPRPTAA